LLKEIRIGCSSHDDSITIGLIAHGAGWQLKIENTSGGWGGGGGGCE